jgi:hypothetical protein
LVTTHELPFEAFQEEFNRQIFNGPRDPRPLPLPPPPAKQ